MNEGYVWIGFIVFVVWSTGLALFFYGLGGRDEIRQRLAALCPHACPVCGRNHMRAVEAPDGATGGRWWRCEDCYAYHCARVDCCGTTTPRKEHRHP